MKSPELYIVATSLNVLNLLLGMVLVGGAQPTKDTSL